MSQVLYKYFNTNYQNNEKKYESETNRINHLMKENSDLIERNKNLEQRLKILEQYVSTNQVQTNNANIYNINLSSNNNNPNTLKSKKKKSDIFNKKNSKMAKTSKSINLSKSTKKIRPKLLNNKNNRNNTNDLAISYSNNIRNKANLSFNLNKFRNTCTKFFTIGNEFNLKENNEYSLKILKEMIEEKKNEIDSLEYEHKLQQIAQKGEGYLDYELNLWQKKTNTLSSSFYQKFNNLKSEAYLDKNEFQNLIRNMKKICEKNQSYEENICQDVISKQIWFINSLDNKNKDIKVRLEKMKNIFK